MGFLLFIKKIFLILEEIAEYIFTVAPSQK